MTAFVNNYNPIRPISHVHHSELNNADELTKRMRYVRVLRFEFVIVALVTFDIDLDPPAPEKLVS